MNTLNVLGIRLARKLERLRTVAERFSDDVGTDWNKTVSKRRDQLVRLASEAVFINNEIEVEECRQESKKLDTAKFERIQRGREILRLYYKDNFTLKQIGDRIGVKKERVRQLLAKAEYHMLRQA